MFEEKIGESAEKTMVIFCWGLETGFDFIFEEKFFGMNFQNLLLENVEKSNFAEFFVK
jgi:hypothetical protein